MINLRKDSQNKKYLPAIDGIHILKSGSISFSPWQEWNSGVNIAYSADEKSFAVLYIECEVIETLGKSQWNSHQTWIYKSHRVLDTPNLSISPSKAETIYNSWVSSNGDIKVLKAIADTVDIDSKAGTELMKRLVWATLWQCFLNEKVSEQETEILLYDFFIFLSTLKNDDYSLANWGLEFKHPATVCIEDVLIDFLKDNFPFLTWKVLNEIFRLHKLPPSAGYFWRQYLSPPQQRFVEQLKSLDKTFLKAVYNDWRMRSDPETDMTQYSWRLLDLVI